MSVHLGAAGGASGDLMTKLVTQLISHETVSLER